MISLIATVRDRFHTFRAHFRQPLGIYLIFICLIVSMCIALRRFAQTIKHQSRIIVHERKMERTRRQERNQCLATAIHDSITRELSSILLLASPWEFASEANLEHVRMDMRGISAQARSALNHAHEVIDLIDDDDMTSQRHESAAVNHLREFLGHEHNAMSSLGLHGTVLFSDTAMHIDKKILSIITAFVREIFANIVRHAQLGQDAYALKITMDGNRMIISQTNQIDVSSQQVMLRKLRHGRGLRSHIRSIAKIGGAVRYRIENGQWFLHAEIPVI